MYVNRYSRCKEEEEEEEEIFNRRKEDEIDNTSRFREKKCFED